VAPCATHSLGAALVVSVACAVTARAETYELGAAVAVAGASDSNPTFAASGADAASFWRVEPQLGLGYDAERVTAKAHLLFDAELYDDAHQGLSTPAARAALEASLHARITPELDAALEGGYYRAALARDLPLVTGVEPGRVSAEAGGARLALGEWLDRRTEVGGEYSFLHMAQGSVEGDLHTEDLALAWKASRRTTLRADVVGRELVVHAGGVATLTPMLGFAYALGPAQDLGVRVGPRLGGDGVEDVEADATLRLRDESARLEVLYLRAQTVVPGAAEPLASDGLSLKGSATWGALTASAAPGLFYTRSATVESWAARGELELRCALTEWLALFGDYRLSWQTVSGPTSATTADHLVLLGVLAGASVTPATWARRGADPFGGPGGADPSGAPEADRAERRVP
jgi:hypothetical protein